MPRVYPEAFLLHIKGRIHAVNILLIQPFAKLLQTFAESLEVDDLPFPQELDNVVYIWVIRKPQDVIISHPGFLFCCYLI